MRVLMPEILGRVAWLIRRGLGVSQQQVADQVSLPPSTVSKLERGDVTMAVHHLDALAWAFTVFDRELRGERAEAWSGWELFQIATLISERLIDRGYVAIWQRTDLVENPALYTRGRALAALMTECWPDELRRRP